MHNQYESVSHFGNPSIFTASVRVGDHTGEANVPAANTLATFPFPRDTIKGWIQEKVWNLTHQWIDPDKVYLHKFSSANSTHSSGAVTGWAHSGTPESSMTLTEAVASDFFSAQRYGTAGRAHG
ncbi:dermonecrotic toxin domain-containing protein [Pseudomonas sp. FP2294]|uniref:dermonecrotic toxin domain-containing protein n=1 Tax=Pseudomonas sp. FP2294 TaxID=2954089 RepID=UPI000E074882|nr:DUF6543 domain-containing protein [Pseudomonas sp. FP2294]WLH58101.1 hypothetical protein PSH73_03360 [Pseudomonas sp. FP2294]SUD42771.1 Uncharacterised protein [Pseudomonas fluorescens]